jgi:hypothetical protein
MSIQIKTTFEIHNLVFGCHHPAMAFTAAIDDFRRFQDHVLRGGVWGRGQREVFEKLSLTVES